jgi:hypothetical protein
LIREFQLLYNDYPLLAEDTGLTDFHIRVARPAGLRRWFRPQIQFILEGVVPFEPFPLRLALPLLEWGLNWSVANYAHQFLMFHAAVVEQGGQALILPAPSGGGKSTLCAGLISRGWRLLSDELTLIRPCDGRLVPAPRPVSLKGPSIDVIRDFAPDAVFGPVYRDTRKGTVSLLRAPTESVARAAELARPSWIVFPSYEPGVPAELRPLSRARAFLRILEQAMNYTLLGVKGFETLADVMDACTCYEFRYGNLEEGVARLNQLVTVRCPPSAISLAANG